MTSVQKAYVRRKLIKFLCDYSEEIEAFVLILLMIAALLLALRFETNSMVTVSYADSKAEKITLPTPTPTAKPLTDEEYIKSLPHGALIWQVYGHESTWGKFDGCKNQGLANGFGYAQNTQGYNCFSSVREVSKLVSQWFEKQLQTMTVKQALCYYNLGKVMDSCDYAEYTLAL